MSDTILDIKSLLSETKGSLLDYPGMPGFKIRLAFLSRETLAKIRKNSTTSTYKRGALVEVVNDNMFLQLYTEAAVKGWEGLKMEYLIKLVPIDLPEGADLNATVGFSASNALMLMKSSTDFDSFVSEAATDLANFQSASGKK